MSVVIGLSAVLILFTAFMDVALWGMFNAPIERRRQAAKAYELHSLRASHRQLARDAQQLREQVDMLSSALQTCSEGEGEGEAEGEAETTAPQFATPCRADELTVRVGTVDGPIVCVPASGHGLVLEE